MFNINITGAQIKTLVPQLNIRLKYKQEKAQKLLEHNYQYEINKYAEVIPNEINGEVVIEKRNNNYVGVLFDVIKSIEEVPNSTNYAYDLTIEDTRTFNIYNGLALFDTFHFAGVASKSNVTRGVPRIEEILSLSSEIKNPSLSVYLKPEDERHKDISGSPMVADLVKMPHCLVAGTTGAGKSVGINAMILSILFKAKPDEVRLIMIDPKMLEMSVYEKVPHLLCPVVTDMKQAYNALNWAVNEMERRYKLMSKFGVRNLAGFNKKIMEAEAKGEKLTNPFSLTPEDPEPLYKAPIIVVIIDELADLMMVSGKKIEELIARIAQKARAAGIHLVLAT